MTSADLYDPVMTDADWITRAEAAELLGVHVDTVDRYVHRALITSRRNEITRSVRLKLADVKRVKATREETESGP